MSTKTRSKDPASSIVQFTISHLVISVIIGISDKLKHQLASASIFLKDYYGYTVREKLNVVYVCSLYKNLNSYVDF